MLLNCLCVGAGGFLGSVARYMLGLALPAESTGGFPAMTLAINAAGSFLIGFVVAGALQRAGMNPQLLLFLKVGVCGGFTTFSTFSLETMQLLECGAWLGAAAYVGASVVLCVLLAFAGDAAGTAVFSREAAA